jgi:hypothetical protein
VPGGVGEVLGEQALGATLPRQEHDDRTRCAVTHGTWSFAATGAAALCSGSSRTTLFDLRRLDTRFVTVPHTTSPDRAMLPPTLTRWKPPL